MGKFSEFINEDKKSKAVIKELEDMFNKEQVAVVWVNDEDYYEGTIVAISTKEVTIMYTERGSEQEITLKISEIASVERV